jgi:hypothetical protein
LLSGRGRRILCEAAGADWRQKLYWLLYDRERELEELFALEVLPNDPFEAERGR